MPTSLAPDIPGFTIIDRLGEGGVAAIWRARDPDDRICVIKILHTHLRGEPSLREILQREASLLSMLQTSPEELYIRGLHGEGYGETPDGFGYMVLRYLPGVALSALMQRIFVEQREALPIDICCVIVRDICRGLAFSQRCIEGLVHRDLSPQNVLLSWSDDGARASLIDFGVAFSPMIPELPGAGIAMQGKAPYMSPEQVLGESLDGRSDVFALGVVLWELLSGRRLFRVGDGDEACMRKILAGEQAEYPRVSVHRPDVPEALDELLVAALAFDRDERLSCCDVLREGLEAILDAMMVRLELASYLAYAFGPGDAL